jgi:hypothetical protein
MQLPSCACLLIIIFFLKMTCIIIIMNIQYMLKFTQNTHYKSTHTRNQLLFLLPKTYYNKICIGIVLGWKSIRKIQKDKSTDKLAPAYILSFHFLLGTELMLLCARACPCHHQPSFHFTKQVYMPCERIIARRIYTIHVLYK